VGGGAGVSVGGTDTSVASWAAMLMTVPAITATSNKRMDCHGLFRVMSALGARISHKSSCHGS